MQIMIHENSPIKNNSAYYEYLKLIIITSHVKKFKTLEWESMANVFEDVNNNTKQQCCTTNLILQGEVMWK